ncbi:MAG: hypothetical protein AB1Z55_00875 [Acidimicrobiia bacterium]
MEQPQDRSTSLRDLWKLVLAVLGVVAIMKELRKPKDEREWHGHVAGFVPYELRFPTPQRFKDTYWSPGGPLFGSKVFGVGWAPNFGAVAALFGIGYDEEEHEAAEEAAAEAEEPA